MVSKMLKDIPDFDTIIESGSAWSGMGQDLKNNFISNRKNTVTVRFIAFGIPGKPALRVKNTGSIIPFPINIYDY